MTPIEEEYEMPDLPANNADELFAKVTAVEKAVSSAELDLGEALALYERCMGIMIESTVVDLSTAQRTDLNTRMDRLNAGLQQQAMTELMD